MSRNDTRQLSHGVRINYTGEAGEEGPVTGAASKGFLSHLATILTSGMNGGSPFSNAMYLTSYGSSADSLTEGSLYNMTCKMIGSNDHNYDHFHFENSHRINFGTSESLGENVPEDLMDKITMIAMGIIVAIDTVKDPLYKGKTTVIATLKHTDYDPFTRMNVNWMTKHYIPPMRNMEKAQVLCVLGREVQFTGIIRDYDAERFMWATEVNAISVTSGHIGNVKASPKAPGKPTHGRTPLIMKSKMNTASTSSSTSVNDNTTNPMHSSPHDPDVMNASINGTVSSSPTEITRTPTGPSKRARRE